MKAFLDVDEAFLDVGDLILKAFKAVLQVGDLILKAFKAILQVGDLILKALLGGGLILKVLLDVDYKFADVRRLWRLLVHGN